MASPYGKMSSLVAAQERHTKYSRVEPDASHLIGDYGKQTLGRMKQAAQGNRNNLTENALRNREQELLDDLVRYRDRQGELGNGTGPASKVDYSPRGVLIESQVRSVGGSRGYVSPPSMPQPRGPQLESAKPNPTQLQLMSPQ